jgi:predicted oxidoreductase
LTLLTQKEALENAKRIERLKTVEDNYWKLELEKDITIVFAWLIKHPASLA